MILGVTSVQQGVSLQCTSCFSVHPVPNSVLPSTPNPHWRCCVSKKKKVCYFSSLLGSAPPTHTHTSKQPVSLLMWISNLCITSPSSLHKLPLPQPLILPSDEGERGRGVTARGSDGERKRWRWRDRDPKKNQLLLASEIWHLPNENVKRQHPMKSGGGPARFSIMSSFFGGSDWFAFVVVVVVLILLTFKIDLKKRKSRGYKC